MKVLITGASSGIGRELARLLAGRCRELVLVGRDVVRLEALEQELLAAHKGLRVASVAMDLSRTENCRRLYETHPDVDFLINNAGFGIFGEFCQTDLETELGMIDTNVKALHILTKLYLVDMVDRDRGRVLNVASIAGFMPGPLMAAYYASKAYVVRLSEAIRKELRARGSRVKISILCPGPVETGFAQTARIAFHFVGADPRKTAEYALSHLDRFYIVPGFPIRASRLMIKALPTAAVTSAVFWLQSRRQGNDAAGSRDGGS